jgi:hypothetical protein
MISHKGDRLMRSKHLSASPALFAASLLLFAAPALSAQSVRGKLLDQATERPIAGATVSLVTEPNATPVTSAKTGSDGGFALTAPSPGVYRLLAELPGYRTSVTPAMDLPAGLTVNFTWRILANAYRLTPVVVMETNKRPSGQQNDFYQRIKQRSAFGRLITRDQIERQHPFRVTDLLRTIPGLQVMPAAFGDVVRTTEGCTPLVYLDGIRFPLMGESIDAIVNPNDLEAVEVYPHATEVPVELSGPGSACGVIALWTRRG